MKRPLRTSGTVQRVLRGALHIRTSNGDQWLVKVPEKAGQVQYTADAEANWLRPGMFVQFSGTFDKRGKAQAPIDQLTVFTPREGFRLGITADDALGGTDLFNNDDKAKKKAPKKSVSSFLVAGRITSARKGNLQVAAGRTRVSVQVSEKARIRVDVADLSLVRPGDKVEVNASIYPQDPRRYAYASQLTVQAAKPLSNLRTRTTPQKKGPTGKEAEKKDAAEKKDEKKAAAKKAEK